MGHWVHSELGLERCLTGWRETAVGRVHDGIRLLNRAVGQKGQRKKWPSPNLFDRNKSKRSEKGR